MVPPFSLGGSQSILLGLHVLQQAEFRHCVGPSGFSHLQATFGQTSYKVALRSQALGLDRSCWGKGWELHFPEALYSHPNGEEAGDGHPVPGRRTWAPCCRSL